jgi:hypothetical protein
MWELVQVLVLVLAGLRSACCIYRCWGVYMLVLVLEVQGGCI